MRFEHGVASGDPTTSGVVLWTRVSGAGSEPTPVGWELRRDDGDGDVVAAGTASTDPVRDGVVSVDVDGLDPDTRYRYRFVVGDEPSREGRTRTLPDGGTRALRVAVTSCAKYSAGYFNAYRAIADRDDIDLWMHLGDYIYEYPTDDGKAPGPEIGRPMEPPHECRSLSDYRRRYAHYRLDPDLQDLHAKVPLIAIPDDHEFCNDTWREGAKYHDPEKDGPWEERKRAALDAWRGWLPHRLPDRRDESRIYRSFGIGDLADVFVLDARTMRDEMTKDPDVRDHEDRTMLGAEQLDWLVRGLEASRARWKIVATPVMLGQVSTDFLPEDVGDPFSELGILTADEHGPNPDQWDGYPAERRRLFEALESSGIQDVVFLSGDVHSSWAVELRPDPDADVDRSLGVEFVTTSVTSENLDEELGVERRTASARIEEEVRERNPHIRWVELDNHGWLEVEIQPERVVGTWHYVRALRERTTGTMRGESWEVRRGEPRLHKLADADPDAIGTSGVAPVEAPR